MPPLTFPLADESVMVPRLLPTNPPAILIPKSEVALPTVTFAADDELLMVPRFCPTRPPAMMPVKFQPLTLPPLAVTWLITPVALLVPTSRPRFWLLPVALTVQLASVKLRNVPLLNPSGAGPLTFTLLMT